MEPLAGAEDGQSIVRRFNRMVRDGEIGPVMMGRDHHDTGGTDSPYRETANIYDGSNSVADMSHQCWAGNANAIETVDTWNHANAARGHVTVPRVADDQLLEDILDQS